MNEETLRKEFEDWVDETFGYGISPSEVFHARLAWEQATRRADKLAREECVEICEKDFNLFSAAAIRATIKEE